MMIEEFEQEDFNEEQDLAEWVMGKVEAWKEHYDSEYRQKHEEYYRIWRGVWAAQDKTRESERSRIISPATQQAVETRHAEVIEAIFGQGEFFDIQDAVPYMNQVMQVKKEWTLPSITHADGSARVQTVNKKQNDKRLNLRVDLFLYEKIPLINNTSIHRIVFLKGIYLKYF